MATTFSTMTEQQQPVKQDTYTVQNPDGTFVTTTTTVKTKVNEDVAYGFGPGTVNKNYCFTPEGIIRIIEIVGDYIHVFYALFRYLA